MIETLHRLPGKFVSGESIFAREWDICCILDGCRVDTFREFYPQADSYWSVDASSREWIRKTFDRDVSNVGYITANPFAGESDPSRFAYYHQEPVQETEYGIETVPPQTLSDHAISLWNEREKYGVEKVVVHYMQPHVPFRRNPGWFDTFSGTETWGSCLWSRAASGEINKPEWFAAYRDNLRWVLDSGVDRLTSCVNARVGVTADHGNACGEWGISGHPHGVAVPSVRKVPWVTLEGTATNKVEPVPLAGGSLDDVEQQLQALGYK